MCLSWSEIQEKKKGTVSGTLSNILFLLKACFSEHLLGEAAWHFFA
jgi:hypothetical protein